MNAQSGSKRRNYDRVARLNRVLKEVIAEEIERESEFDDRLVLLTVTDVVVDPDLKRARVFLASLTEETEIALAEIRVAIQRRVGREMRLKRTPLLSFEVDPSLEAGERIEAILRRVSQPKDQDEEGE